MNVSDLDPARLMELHGLAAGAARRAGAEEDAADIAQDTIAKLEDRDLDEINNLEAWVQRVAKNAALDLNRRANRIEVNYDGEFGVQPSFSTSLVAQRKIRDLIEELPTKYRAVIQLTYFQGLSAAQVGERLGYTTATVHKMLTEVRTMLRPNITAPPGYEG